MTKPTDNAIEIETCCGMKEGGEFSPSLEVWVIQCCACQQYFDVETREKIDKPPDNALITHSYCHTCKVKLEKEIDAMTAPVAG